uniref:Uncharacterized protein n=1 Tax=Oryza brachyantha TaxID=4533 RepID=J3LHP3_ORYBR
MPPFVLGAAAAIHLGNTNSCIAGYGHAGPGPGPGARPNYYQFCILSWVAIAGDGTILSGEAAMNHAASSPRAAISAFMRLLDQRHAAGGGRRGEERDGACAVQVHQDAWMGLPFPPTGGHPWRSCWKEFSLAHIAGILISHLKKMAEAHLGSEINNAVVTAPSRLSYTDDGKESLSLAARGHAGFRAVKVVDQHIAAAAAYGHHTTQGDRKAILVFHLGGRTSHATIFKFVDGTARLIDTIVDHFLGGDDFTATIVDHLAELIKKQHGRDVRQDKAAMARLKVACEQAKRALSEQQETLVQIDSLLDDGVVFSAPLTRADFEELNHHLFHRALGLVEEVVKGRVEMVDEIVVVGGSARIPKVRRLLRDYFHGRRPNSRKGVEPEEAVVHGAALLARPVAVVQPQAARDLEVEEDSHSSLDFDHWFRGATDKRVYKV